MSAPADAPPVETINESSIPMDGIVHVAKKLPVGSTLLYQPSNQNQRNPDLFLIHLKQKLNSTGNYQIIQTQNGVKITKA